MNFHSFSTRAHGDGVLAGLIRKAPAQRMDPARYEDALASLARVDVATEAFVARLQELRDLVAARSRRSA